MLEIAEQVAKLRRNPRNRLRFAFWGTEEAGLVGSTAYVAEQVETGGIEEIEANLNFDMLGSVNFVPFVYDGERRAAAERGAGGLGPDRAAVPAYFGRRRLASDPTPFDGRSDSGPSSRTGSRRAV